MARLARPTSELLPRYDVVVVGSGYGGGVAASRLARAGLSVAVLERGREILPGEFPSSLAGAARELQTFSGGKRIGRHDGLFDVRLGPDVGVLAGCGLGGTSLINANVCLNPDGLVFEDECWPAPIRTDHYLSLAFDRARRMLAPEPLPMAFAPTKLAAFERAAAALGRSVERVPLHMAFEARVNAAGVRQPACVQCGDCMGGCNVGAKTTVHATYLADAVNYGATLFTGLKVRFVEPAREGGWRVVAHASGEAKHVPMRTVTAAMVVIAAGTLGTSEILVRSRERGLSLSDRLGKSVSTNADAVSFSYDERERVGAIGAGYPGKLEGDAPGPAVTGLIDLRRRRDPAERIAIVECAVPSAVAGLLPLLVPAAAAAMPTSELDLQARLAELKDAAASVAGGASNGALAKTQLLLTVGHDSAGGEIVPAGDEVEIRWPDLRSEPVFGRMATILDMAAKASGGSLISNPLSRPPFGGPMLTFHPLGGAPMGRDRTQGVVDHKCRVFDGDPRQAPDAVHRGLYVMDGSVMPRSLGIHPLLTIAAIAERAVMLLARDLGRALDVTQSKTVPVREFKGDGYVEPGASRRRAGWGAPGVLGSFGARLAGERSR